MNRCIIRSGGNQCYDIIFVMKEAFGFVSSYLHAITMHLHPDEISEIVFNPTLTY